MMIQNTEVPLLRGWQEFQPELLEGMRVVLFDVYGTLLRQRANPDPEAGFVAWWERFLGGTKPPGLREFENCLANNIHKAHEAARGVGVDYPEVQWPEILAQGLSDFGIGIDRAEPGWHQAVVAAPAIWHTVELMPGADEVLQLIKRKGLPLGLASNAQNYTIAHLHAALAQRAVTEWTFDEEWTFWSWRLGFSKPSAHFFQIPSARAAAKGWAPGQILYVGDSIEKDVVPASRFGWKVLLFSEGIAENASSATG